jgi:hypothetical protein
MVYASNAESLRPVGQGCAKSIGRRAICGIVRKEPSVNGWDFAEDAVKRNRLPEAITAQNVTNLNMNVCDQKTTL